MMVRARTAAFAMALWVGLVAGAEGATSTAHDSWQTIARGVRYRHRTELHDGRWFDLHAAYIDLGTPGVALRVTAPSERAERPSTWARRVDALVAVNGDYFTEPGRLALGPTRGAGQWWPASPRMHRDALFAFGDGAGVHLFDAPTMATDALWSDAPQTIPAAYTEVIGVRERVLVAGAVRLSPRIVHDGGRHPRTAAGLTEDRRTLVLLVVDGRSENASGATTRELGALLRELGAYDGMKFDGGGSSAMYVRGLGVVNHPSDGSERVVANHLGVVVRAPTP